MSDPKPDVDEVPVPDSRDPIFVTGIDDYPAPPPQHSGIVADKILAYFEASAKVAKTETIQINRVAFIKVLQHLRMLLIRHKIILPTILDAHKGVRLREIAVFSKVQNVDICFAQSMDHIKEEACHKMAKCIVEKGLIYTELQENTLLHSKALVSRMFVGELEKR